MGYATCKNGVVTMQTVRTTAWRSAKDQRTFHIPKQMGYDRCKISVKARQTDYGNNGVNNPSWNERLVIKHKDVNVKLHQNCGFKHQCYNDLYTCKLDKSEEMVTIDHGEPDWITIEGENGQGTDYCPFNPLKDLTTPPSKSNPSIRPHMTPSVNITTHGIIWTPSRVTKNGAFSASSLTNFVAMYFFARISRWWSTILLRGNSRW